MSTNIITVISLIGDAAIDVTKNLQDVQLRKLDNGNSIGDDSWNITDQEIVNDLIRRIESKRTQWPISAYFEYLDPWSVAGSNFHFVNPNQNSKNIIYTEKHILAYYPSSEYAKIIARNEVIKRKTVYRKQTVDRWYALTVAELVNLQMKHKFPSIVLAYSKFIGASRDSDDYIKSLSIKL